MYYFLPLIFTVYFITSTACVTPTTAYASLTHSQISLLVFGYVAVVTSTTVFANFPSCLWLRGCSRIHYCNYSCVVRLVAQAHLIRYHILPCLYISCVALPLSCADYLVAQAICIFLVSTAWSSIIFITAARTYPLFMATLLFAVLAWCFSMLGPIAPLVLQEYVRALAHASQDIVMSAT